MDVQTILRQKLKGMESESSSSKSGIHWVNYYITDNQYEGKMVFKNTFNTNIARVYYLNANTVDEKNTFTPWFLEKCNGGGSSSGGSKGGSSKRSSSDDDDDDTDSGYSSSEPEPEPVPMSPEERAIVESPLPVKSDPLEQLEALVDHYSEVIKITSGVPEECDMIQSKLEAIEQAVEKTRIPSAPAALMALALCVAKCRDKGGLFTKVPKRSLKQVKKNIAEVLKTPAMKHNAELHAVAKAAESNPYYKSTPIFEHVLREDMEIASARGHAEDAELLMNNIDTFIFGNDYFEKMTIVTEREELLKVAQTLQRGMKENAIPGASRMANISKDILNNIKSNPLTVFTACFTFMYEVMKTFFVATANMFKTNFKQMLKGRLIVIPEGSASIIHTKLGEVLDKADELYPGDSEFAEIRKSFKKGRTLKIILYSLIALLIVVVIVTSVVCGSGSSSTGKTSDKQLQQKESVYKSSEKDYEQQEKARALEEEKAMQRAREEEEKAMQRAREEEEKAMQMMEEYDSMLEYEYSEE